MFSKARRFSHLEGGLEVVEISFFCRMRDLYIPIVRALAIRVLVFLVVCQLGFAKFSFGDSWWWMIDEGERDFFFLLLSVYLAINLRPFVSYRYVMKIKLIRCRDGSKMLGWGGLYIEVDFLRFGRVWRNVYSMLSSSDIQTNCIAGDSWIKVSGDKYYFYFIDNCNEFIDICSKVCGEV